MSVVVIRSPSTCATPQLDLSLFESEGDVEKLRSELRKARQPESKRLLGCKDGGLAELFTTQIRVRQGLEIRMPKELQGVIALYRCPSFTRGRRGRGRSLGRGQGRGRGATKGRGGHGGTKGQVPTHIIKHAKAHPNIYENLGF